MILELPVITVYPVTFTVVDDGNNYQDVEIKGDLPPDYDWNLRNMNADGNTWTYTISLQSGTYQWGAIENDGTEWGIWLPELAGFSSNPSVTIGNDGAISGVLTFTVPNQNNADPRTRCIKPIMILKRLNFRIFSDIKFPPFDTHILIWNLQTSTKI